MKQILFKTILIVNLFLIYNCKAQTTSDYTNFYDNVVPKLNFIVPNKTQFYGQNFSNFYNELQSKNIDVELLDYESKITPSNKYYVLKLLFCNINLISIATENNYQYPRVYITFETEIPPQIKSMVEQSNSQWTYDMIQFFANMKIEKIEFIGLNGYNSSDRSIK